MELIKSKKARFILGILFITAFFGILYKIYIPRVNAFGCFDDCFNIMGGYFIFQGKEIFKDFFFNHQPGMAYLSALVHLISNPQSIAELILSHRQAVFILSFILTLLLYLRFGFKILIVSVFYELSKFYVFGDRFLAESLVPYLIVYQLGVLFEIINKRKLKIDVYLMPVITFTILILREPYTFASLTSFILFSGFYFKKSKKLFIKSWGIFIFLLISFLLLHSLRDYFFNVVTINQSILKTDALNQPLLPKLLKIIAYPIYFIVANEPWTILRSFVAIISAIFLFSFFYVGYYLRKWKLVIVIIIMLALVNLRPGPANVQFFEAFNISVWLLSLIFSTVFLITIIQKKTKKTGKLLTLLMIVPLAFLISNKNYFVYEKVNTNDEFFTNFSYEMDIGTTIRDISNSNDTLFVDGYDDLVIWESRLNSPYKHNWYTSFMPRIKTFQEARDEMFVTSPPDFYYGECWESLSKKDDKTSLFLKRNYSKLTVGESRGCVWIKNEKLKKIPNVMLEKLDKTKFNITNSRDK